MKNDLASSDIHGQKSLSTDARGIASSKPYLGARTLSPPEYQAQHDDINHPFHYTSSKGECPGCERKIECIDVARHMNFNLGNAVKYLWRSEHKGGKEDLKKAIWYIQNEIDKK